jgi:hypothetical protein
MFIANPTRPIVTPAPISTSRLALATGSTPE